MTKLTASIAVFTLSLMTAGIASAQTDHGHGSASPDTTAPGSPMGDEQAPMMQKMMQMHAKMMGGGADMMGGGSGMPMMDRDMMRMMMGSGMMAQPSAAEAGVAMQARLAEFDANGDGFLSLPEFEALHAAMTRETTVDRFQHLDADGDGQVSATEMAAPSQRMGMRGMMQGGSMGGSRN